MEVLFCPTPMTEGNITNDLYSKKDMKLVFSRFISRGEILWYSR